MTLPQNVKDAVKNVAQSLRDTFLEEDIVHEQVAEIRAHLMSQEAEIDRLNAECKQRLRQAMENGCAANLAESRLAAANALLRECHCYFEARGVEVRTIGESLSLNEKIQSHLQGAGDEAAASPEFLCPCGSSLCNGEEDEA